MKSALFFPLVLALAGASCGESSAVVAAAPAGRPTALLANADGKELEVRLEVADNDATRRRGLMWRQSMPDSHGMLFIFPYEEIQSFWMKNTLIPLDMLFINSRHEIVGIVHEAEPRTLESRRVDRPSTYVLEVNGGWARKNKVRPGQTVRLVGVPGHEKPRPPVAP